MNKQKRPLAILLTILMVLSALPVPVGFANEIPESLPDDGSDFAVTDFQPDENDPYQEYVTYEAHGDKITVIPMEEEGQLSVRFPEEADSTLDWDGILDQLWTLIYTDVSSINVYSYGMRYPEDYSYFHNQNYFNPIFLRVPVRLTYYPSSGIIDSIYIEEEDYKNGAENLRRYYACLDAIDQLMYGVKDDPSLSPVDKCLVLHDRLAAWCEYDYSNYLAGTIPDESYSPYGPLVLRTGVCNGIALAYGWMMDMLGIENYYTSSDTLNHGWNMVWLDGEPYYLDVTHDDPVWDVTGRVNHNYFMVSFNTYSAGHNASDFPDTPVSTLYENYFCKNTNTEIVYIGGNLYYLNQTNGNLIRRTPAGDETVIKTVDYRYSYSQNGSTYSTNFLPKMTSIGDYILYLAPREVHAFNPVTGEDSVVYTPSDSIFPEVNYRLTGLEQRDGVVYVTASNSTIFSADTKAAYTESFVFCQHPAQTVLEQLKGDSCQTLGAARVICPDCRRLEYVAGGGVYGDHEYSSETANDLTLAAEASCTSPARYYYSCSYCGAVEYDDAHTFSFGQPTSHAYVPTVIPAAETCPGYTVKRCADCGNEIFDSFSFYAGNTANGVIGDTFAWQIVNGILSVYGQGALPDYSAGSPAPWSAYAADITGVYVNDGINKIGAYDFYGLTAMETVRLPEEVTSIGTYAFYNANALTAFVCPAELARIEPYAFGCAKALSRLEYNAKLSYLGAYAFEYLESMQTVVLPGSLTSVGSQVFYKCKNVKTIIVEEGITDLPSFIFPFSTSSHQIETIYLPSTMRTISEISAYNVLTWCKNIEVSDENPYFASVDGVLFDKAITRLIKYPDQHTGVYYQVPASVSALGGRAFYGTRNLKYLDLSATAVTSLQASVLGSNQYSPIGSIYGSGVFVNLPAGLTDLGNLAFGVLSQVNQIYVPSSVNTVSDTFMAQATKPVIVTDSDAAAVVAACTALGQTYSVLGSHSHAFTNVVYTEAGDCRTPGVTIRTCECGQFEIAETAAEHDFTGEIVKDEALKAPATCTVAAVYYYSCSVCGTVEGNDSHTFTSGSPTAHSFTAATVKADALKSAADCHSPAVYYYSCAVCGAVEMNAAHTFTSGEALSHQWTWVIDSEADCGNAGEKHEECSLCGDIRNEGTVIEATGNHTWGWVTDTAATCGTAGVQHEECSVCHQTKNLNTPIEATGVHSFTANTVKDEALKDAANCSSAAVYYYSCAFCGTVERNDSHTFTSGSPAAHSFTAATVKADALKSAADCHSPAVYYYSCAVCGKVEKNDSHTFTSGASLSHQWQWITDSEADCGNTGLKHEACSLCGDTRNAGTVIPATGNHSYQWVTDTEATCGTAGVQHEECGVCHQKRNENTVIEATGNHTWGWVTDTPATCGNAGVKHEECAVCRETRSLNTAIPATGNHNWMWKIDTPATCGKAGVQHQECAVCGSTRNANTPIAATGNHSWNGGTVTKAATCTETGVKTFTCTVCGAARTENIGKTAHADGNGDGYCDVCHTDMDAAGRCKYCGEKHTGFFGGIVKFFHSILYFFKNMFK